MSDSALRMLEDRLRLLESFPRRAYGKYRGEVIDNANDPISAGRLKVRVPEIHGDDSVWAWPCVPYAGDQVGWFVMPPVGAGVWVEFEAGDPSKAIWVGCFWGSGQLPPDATSADTRLLQTTKAQLKIDDEAGEVLLKNDQNASTTWAADIITEAGSATHTVGADGVVSEASPGKVEVGASGVSINDGVFTVM